MRALAHLRHLYANMLDEGVLKIDTLAKNKQIANGLLSPAIAELEKKFDALTKLCDEAEGLAKGEDGEQLKALVFTKQIRKILSETT